MSVSETINKLKSNWNFGYIDETKIEFEELEELEKMNDKIKKLEYEKAQIRKQVCDEIRENAKYTNWSKEVPFVYVITTEQLSEIEKGEE